MRKIIKYLLKPFDSNHLNFIVVIFLLSSFNLCYYYIKKDNIIFALFYICLYSYSTSYILCLIKTLLPKYISTIYKSLIIILVAIYFFLSFFCVQIYDNIDLTFVTPIIMQTNVNEALEFCKEFMSLKLVVSILMITIITIGLYKIIKKINLKTILKVIALFIVPLTLYPIIKHPPLLKTFFLLDYQKLFDTERIPNLEEYLTFPEIVRVKNNQPKNIVLILGESFSKSHSSLYGYVLNTNPNLQALANDNLLYSFLNTTSPATSTIPCLQSILSSYKVEYDSIQWYKCTTIMEIAHKCGYNTTWVSNQSKVGFFDTVGGRYADLCNTNIFVGDKFEGCDKSTFDDEVIPLLKNQLKDDDSYNMFFVHLLGSHSVFEKRYPKTFDFFKPENYPTLPQHQRQKVASYDNSILYNDEVVNNIISLFKEKETIILYFSDHGLDIYESSDDYIGHAKLTSLESMEFSKKIPFFIYTSPSYQKNFPEVTNAIKNSTNKQFCTDDIILTIMDIIGVKINNIDILGESLLKGNI